MVIYIFLWVIMQVDGVEDVADVGAVKASDGSEMITCSSDSSPCPRSEKHEPA